MFSPFPFVFDWAFLAAALAGAAIGGYKDLKTTEIPDWVPLSMAVSGAIIHAVRAIYYWDATLLFLGLAVAGAFLAFGYLLYYAGQWGEADVLMLGAIGFLIPQPLAMFSVGPLTSGFLFPLSFVLNLFVIGSAYSLLYAAVIAVRSKKVFPAYWRDLVAHAKELGLITGGIFAGVAAVITALYLLVAPAPFLFNLLITLPLAVALWLLYRFARVLEHVAFRMRIPVSKLREGDMLAENIKGRGIRISSRLYIGLTKAQVRAIKKLRPAGRVLIKGGIRYSPTFALTILATWAFGNVLFALLGIGS